MRNEKEGTEVGAASQPVRPPTRRALYVVYSELCLAEGSPLGQCYKTLSVLTLVLSLATGPSFK